MKIAIIIDAPVDLAESIKLRFDCQLLYKSGISLCLNDEFLARVVPDTDSAYQQKSKYCENTEYDECSVSTLTDP